MLFKIIPLIHEEKTWKNVVLVKITIKSPYFRKLFSDLFERKGYVYDGEFDWTGRRSLDWSLPSSVNNVLSPNKDLHRPVNAAATPGRSDSRPSGIEDVGLRIYSDRRAMGSNHNILSKDDAIIPDSSNAPIAAGYTDDEEEVSETKCCCFFKRRVRKKKNQRS